MIKGRAVLQKMRVMESRLRYQIKKLVRVTDESSKALPKVSREDGIFHHLRSTPMLYVGTASNKHSKRRPAPKTLSSLIQHSLLWSSHLCL
ncbi:hypothetical protein EV401DRAFT_2030108 [Pisolithus croceorrhizus]|nr:hypothetical protein EV401DRAFT_2030108 [Pisolithus croceorrhizus]